jgi:hypothetical protein
MDVIAESDPLSSMTHTPSFPQTSSYPRVTLVATGRGVYLRDRNVVKTGTNGAHALLRLAAGGP